MVVHMDYFVSTIIYDRTKVFRMVVYSLKVIGLAQGMLFKNGHRLKLKVGDFVRIRHHGETSVGQIQSKTNSKKLWPNRLDRDKNEARMMNMIKKVKV